MADFASVPRPMCISPHARVHHIAAANVPEKVVLVLSCTGNHSIEMAGAACDTTQREPPQGQLASIVVENYTIANVTAVLTNSDCKLECQVLATLDQLSKHSVELVVLVAQVFPETLSGLHKPGEFVQIVKRSAKDQHELRAHVCACGRAVRAARAATLLHEPRAAANGAESDAAARREERRSGERRFTMRAP
ncbi:unnamed protein product [Lampetra planeri]